MISRKEDLSIFLESHPLHQLYGGEHAYHLSTYLKAIESAGIKLKNVLNPLESDINLYPITQNDIKKHISKRLLFVSPKWIPDVLLKIMGKFDKTPGRLFSFIGQKI